MTTINDILISELDRASVPAEPEDELVLNQIGPSGEFETKRINWAEIGQSIRDLSGDPDRPGITDQVLFGDGTEPAPSITFKNDTSTGIYRPINIPPSIGISVDGYDALRLTRVGSQSRAGIGFNYTTEYPQDGLHIKSGGILIDWSPGFQFKLTNSNTDDWETGVPGDSSVRLNVETNNNLTFATNDKERGRFTKQGDFAFYRALGVGGYSTDDFIKVDYGKAGDATKSGSILISNGPGSAVEWKDPENFFDENVTIISDILVNNPEFIENITKNLNYDTITNILLNYDGFIDAIIDNLDLEIDIELINDNLGDLNVGDGLTFEKRDTGSGSVKDFLIVDNTIARGVYDSNTRRNLEIDSAKITADEIIATKITSDEIIADETTSDKLKVTSLLDFSSLTSLP